MNSIATDPTTLDLPWGDLPEPPYPAPKGKRWVNRGTFADADVFDCSRLFYFLRSGDWLYTVSFSGRFPHIELIDDTPPSTTVTLDVERVQELRDLVLLVSTAQNLNSLTGIVENITLLTQLADRLTATSYSPPRPSLMTWLGHVADYIQEVQKP